jgi:hypothetical protein
VCAEFEEETRGRWEEEFEEETRGRWEEEFEEEASQFCR